MESAPLRVEVLGPLRVVVQGAAVDVRGPKRRAVLALLALAEGRAVSVDRLVHALWPAEIPESGRQALHSHVSRLRGHLGVAAERLETLDGGYRLALDEADLDVTQARGLLTRARVHAQEDPVTAIAVLRQARGLWRGPVLADLGEIAPVAAAAVHLEQLRSDVTDTLIDCCVTAGRTDPAHLDGVVGIAVAALENDPLREPAVLRLMRALAAAGRASDALQAGREFRQRLVDEAGLDPSANLGELERDIAGGALGPVPRPVARPAVPARPATRLIGRDGQLAALHRALNGNRLVTLVGPGGVGKTRVALEVAADRQAPVLLLAPVTDPGSVPNALAAALALQVVRGDVLSTCVEVLRTEPSLLVIDNCEHLLAATRDLIATLIDRCPDLTILATSREPLGLTAERVSRLAGLPVPGDTVDDLPTVPSVAIFLDRASRSSPGFTPETEDMRVIADIVRRLDGLPLAIELAAGRVATFSLPDLHSRLDRSLDLLGAGRTSIDSRHRTLRTTIEWSYELLTGDEQTLFRHLSAFPDGVDLDTVEFVAADLGLPGDPGTLLARLVDASMIEAARAGRTRYRMLQTLRTFGLDRLRARNEDADAAARVLRRAIELATWIDAIITTDREPEADAALRRELGNLRAAWHLARDHDTIDDAVTLVIALHEATAWRDLTEIWQWSEELLGAPDLLDHPRAAQVLGVAAEAAYLRGDYPRAEQLARQGISLTDDPAAAWPCLTSLAGTDLFRGAFADALEHSVTGATSALRPTIDFGVAALAAAYSGDPGHARALNTRMAAIAQSPTHQGWVAYVAGEIDNACERWDLAEANYGAAIEFARRAGTTFVVGVSSVGLVTALTSAGRTDDALRGYLDVIDYWAAAGNWTHLWVTLANLTTLLRRLGDAEPATIIDDAVARAPDAPTTDPSTGTAPAPSGPILSRTQVLDTARQAIGRHLDR